jgi:hypothetical protein
MAVDEIIDIITQLYILETNQFLIQISRSQYLWYSYHLLIN